MAADQQVGLLHAELTERILGAFYEVYRELGFGFLESVYEGAMVIALQDLGLRVRRQAEILVWFRGRCVGRYRADLLVEELVVLEMKAARTLEPGHEAQLLNSLKATTIEVGIVLNFGPRPQFKRMAFSNTRKNLQPPDAAAAAHIS